jgi:myo-inositol-1-phosphate synthase
MNRTDPSTAFSAAELTETARVGVWFVGARGSVATTATIGALAVSRSLAAPTGLVCELPALAGAKLSGLKDLVFGGHDVVDTPLAHRAAQLAAGGVLPGSLVHSLTGELAEADVNLRIAEDLSDGRAQGPAAADLSADIREFAERNGCARVVVVNVSPTEAPATPHPALADLGLLEIALAAPGAILPRSSLFAYAAFKAGASFVDFTPSSGARLPALEQLALRENLPWAGSDGKTGETLLKSALAPMFADRALRVRSWAGTNLLGGGDGATLADPELSESKLISKARVLKGVLGYDVHSPLHIDDVPDLGDWKTAWDHISFEGFLGTRMSMQFTWQGCDSALAAPLVLDLIRLIARAHEVGESGPQSSLAFFFKDPINSDEHRLSNQFDELARWASLLGTSVARAKTSA